VSGSGESGKGKDKGKPPGSRRQKLISEDDRALWRFVAKSIGPARGKSRVRDVEPNHTRELSGDFEAELEAKLAARLRERPPSQKRTSQAKSAPVPAPAALPLRPPRSSPPAPQHITLDRRKARRIARGTDEIDARLDLHGMTQADAQWALIGFVRRCHAGGLRTLLVITGKGNAARSDGDEVMPRPRGVLRQNVPRWLAGPEIGSLVVSYTTAHIRHGGEGALYVRLRG
jgi:DNA-nicking Smr family endonuclease